MKFWAQKNENGAQPVITDNSHSYYVLRCARSLQAMTAVGKNKAMKHKAISFIAGLVACATSALAADFIEIKGAHDLDNIRIPIKAGSAYYAQIQALPNADAMISGKTDGKEETGFYVGYSLHVATSKKGIEGSFVGNLLQGFIDFGAQGEGKKLSPVLNSFEKKFSIKKPGKQWTKVTVYKDTTYEVRWISE
ncbi:MAG: hypothetical protein WC661_12770 [Opitutaceae bacterium]|jgi:hypothetical protein